MASSGFSENKGFRPCGVQSSRAHKTCSRSFLLTDFVVYIVDVNIETKSEKQTRAFKS